MNISQPVDRPIELKISGEKYERNLPLYQDADQRYFYNLLQTLSLPTKLPLEYYGSYTIRYGDTWPLISYNIYGSTNLYWLVLEANKILDPTLPLIPGTDILFFIKDLASAILTQLNTQ